MVSAKFILAAASVLCQTWAQTPGGFTPNQQQTMGVAFGSNTISPAGKLIAQSDASSAPSLNSIALGASTTGLAVMVDSSINRLHWIASGITPDLSSANGATLKIPSSGSNSVAYAGPQPPAGSTHTYVILLYTQPNNFALPSTYSADNRANFDINTFQNDLKLGSPLAANYFTVSGSGSASSSGSSSASSASSSRSAASSASSLVSSISSRVSSAVASASSAASGASSTASSAVATATRNAAVAMEGSALLGLAAAGVAAFL